MRRIMHPASNLNDIRGEARGERAEAGSDGASYVEAVLFRRRRTPADRADRTRLGEVPATNKKGTIPCAS